MDGEAIAAALNARDLSGVHFVNQPFVPVSGLFAGQRCRGVGVKVTDRVEVRSMRIGLEIAAVLIKMYPKEFDVSKIVGLLGNDEAVRQLQAGVAPKKIVESWAADLAAFEVIRRKYFLYK